MKTNPGDRRLLGPQGVSTAAFFFGEKHADKYEYQPIVRTIVDVEDSENYFRPPNPKLKLDMSFKDDAPPFNFDDKKDGVRTEVALKSFK